jgi:hypothetical protein
MVIHNTTKVPLAKTHLAKIDKAATEITKKYSSVQQHKVPLNKSKTATINVMVSGDRIEVVITSIA